MDKKIFNNARFTPKGDIEANWNKAVGFIPLDKEIIIYKVDETHPTARFKVGDGKTVVQDLPFSGADVEAIPQADWNQSDETAKDFIKNKPFGEKNLFEPITWDGVVGDKEKVDMSDFTGDNAYAVKVSDAILTYDDYLGATVKIVTPDGEQTLWIPEDRLIPKDEVDSVGACGMLEVATTIIDTNKFNSVLGANLFKVPGTYVLYIPNYSVYVSSLTKSEISKIDEKYLPDSINNKIAELEGKTITAIFNITSENTTIELQNLEGMTKIDWGDGTASSGLTHTYNQVGEYVCKIYEATSIGSYAFYKCSSLTSVEIPDSVTSIGSSAFYECDSLKSVVIGDGVTSIGGSAFKSCNSLTSAVIGDSVTSIGSYAFYSCYRLTSVVIPDSVTSITLDAFRYCSSLTSVVFKNSVPAYYYSWFNNCTALTDIYVPYGCKQAYIDKWTADGAPQNILNLIVESDREAMMSDVNTLKSEIQEQLVGKTDYLGVVDTIPNLPNAEAGDYCRVQTEFVYDAATGEKAHVGDILIAIKDNPTQSIADWDLLHNELASATLVTVGGVAQTSWDADTKVGFTDIASHDKAGLILLSGSYCFGLTKGGTPTATTIDKDKYNASNPNIFIAKGTLENIKHAYVKAGITTNTETWTDEDKAAACETIGAVRTALYSKNAGTSGTDGEYHGRVYAVKYDGTEETVPMANQAKNYSICWRDADANIYVGDPTQQLHCINKRYAEANFVAKPTDTSGFNRVYGINNGSTTTAYYNLLAPAQFGSESDAKRRSGIAYYSGGRLGCAPPERDYEATNKKYVDENTTVIYKHTITINGDTIQVFTTNATPYTNENIMTIGNDYLWAKQNYSQIVMLEVSGQEFFIYTIGLAGTNETIINLSEHQITDTVTKL